MNVHQCDIFMEDGAPCPKLNIVTNFSKSKKIQVLDWTGNSPDLNLIENLWVVLKNKVSEQQPSSLKHLENVMKTVWTRELSSEYCRKLIESMPIREDGYRK